jgi:hypothetical protein
VHTFEAGDPRRLLALNFCRGSGCGSGFVQSGFYGRTRHDVQYCAIPSHVRQQAGAAGLSTGRVVGQSAKYAAFLAVSAGFTLPPMVVRQKNCLVAGHADVMLRSTLVRFVESVAMNENDADTPEQVLKFVPKERPRSYGIPADEAGQAIIAKIQGAADRSNENCDRAMKLAHKLSMQLRAAEERINQLEVEIEFFRDRAARGEGWLQTIQKEIEEKLIAPRSASGSEQRVLP